MCLYISIFNLNTGKHKSEKILCRDNFYAVVVRQFYKYEILDLLALCEKAALAETI